MATTSIFINRDVVGSNLCRVRNPVPPMSLINLALMSTFVLYHKWDNYQMTGRELASGGSRNCFDGLTEGDFLYWEG